MVPISKEVVEALVPPTAVGSVGHKCFPSVPLQEDNSRAKQLFRGVLLNLAAHCFGGGCRRTHKSDSVVCLVWFCLFYIPRCVLLIYLPLCLYYGSTAHSVLFCSQSTSVDS